MSEKAEELIDLIKARIDLYSIISDNDGMNMLGETNKAILMKESIHSVLNELSTMIVSDTPSTIEVLDKDDAFNEEKNG